MFSSYELAIAIFVGSSVNFSKSCLIDCMFFSCHLRVSRANPQLPERQGTPCLKQAPNLKVGLDSNPEPLNS